jgi:hypothetical protein
MCPLISRRDSLTMFCIMCIQSDVKRFSLTSHVRLLETESEISYAPADQDSNLIKDVQTKLNQSPNHVCVSALFSSGSILEKIRCLVKG